MVISMKTYASMVPDDPRRFYPPFVPVLPYEPLKTCFEIIESPEDIQRGVISKVTFNECDLIANLTGFVLYEQTLHSLQVREGLYYADEFFAGYLIHSCEPNAKLIMDPFSLEAISAIKPFTLITIDYCATEKDLFQKFQCKCGSPKCRGWISGYGDSLPEKIKK